MSDEQFEISNQLRIRASRMCCDGYYEFDAKLDVAAADEIERLRGIRENLNRYMPTARLDLVDDERCCSECRGSGIKTYGTSATWRGGSGGMTITTDVCNTCWGNGDAHRPWPSHREIERLRAAGNAAFMAMCAYRDNGDAELFQDAIDALGRAMLIDRP
jgi:hypothetical protein